jgi:hypothetical protein
MDNLFSLFLLVLVGGAFFVALQPRYLFMVRIQDGMARLARGKVTKAFLDEIDHTTREQGVTRGWVGGVRRGRRVVLVFARTIPPAVQQRLRNLWILH